VWPQCLLTQYLASVVFARCQHNVRRRFQISDRFCFFVILPYWHNLTLPKIWRCIRSDVANNKAEIFACFCRSLPSGVDICVLGSCCWVCGWSNVFGDRIGRHPLEGDSRKRFFIGVKLDFKLWGEFWCLIYVILGPRQCWFLSPNFYTKLNVAQNNETNLTKQVERGAVLSSLRWRHAATKTTTKMITAAWINDTLQARALSALPAVPASTDRKPVIKRKSHMTWELKYEFGWSAFHGHKPIISAHSLAVRLWSALRNRDWTESGKSGGQWSASTGSDIGLGLGKATTDAVWGGREIQLQAATDCSLS